RRIIYVGGAPADAGFQVYGYDLDDGRIDKLTDAPYLAFQPNAADGRTLRFLNRDGWQWTLDEVPLPARPAAPAPAAPSVTAPAPPHPSAPAAPRSTARPPGVTAPDAPPAPDAAAPAPPPETAPAPRPETAPPPPVEVIPTIVSDQPASPIDHLFVPHLYGPTV